MGTDNAETKHPDDPFKLVTVGLVVVILVMALLYGMRRMDEQEAMEAARSEVEAVALFLEEGDLPNAVLALHDIGLRLARVDGAEEAAVKVVAAVEDELRTHAATREELAGARREIDALNARLAEAGNRIDTLTERNRGLVAVRELNALVIRNLAHGRIEPARRLVDATEEKDVVGASAEILVTRLEEFGVAAGGAGAERVHALRTLARTWPVSGVAEFATFAGGVEERNRTVRASIAAADLALEREDVAARDTATAAIEEAVQTAGVAELPDLIRGVLTLQARLSAAESEKQGRNVDAAALWRALGETGKAAALEVSIRRDLLAEFLSGSANHFHMQRRLFDSAACLELLQEFSHDPEVGKKKAAEAYAAAWLAQGLEHLQAERLEAAEWAARKAAEMRPDMAAGPLEDIGAALKIRERKESLVRARAALHSGDGKAALALVRGSGAEGVLAAEAELLAGDVTKGAAALEGSDEVKTLALLTAGWTVVGTDAARAARLGLKARELTGGRPGVIALLTAALDAAGDTPKGDELWDAVRAAIFEATAGGFDLR